MAPARALGLALSLLTRAPVRLSHVEPGDHGRALALFPLVGLLIGAAQLGLSYMLLTRLSPMLTATLLILASALITGALHLDGVADTCDAAGGGSGDRERMLVIMRDSRIGAHGAVGLVLLLLVRVTATANVLQAGALDAIVLAPCIARATIPPLVVYLPYARSEGVGSPYGREGKSRHVLVATLPLLSAFAWAAPQAWCSLLLATMAVAGVVAWAMRRLGGLTGDIYGTCVEVAEATALTVAAALAGR